MKYFTKKTIVFASLILCQNLFAPQEFQAFDIPRIDARFYLDEQDKPADASMEHLPVDGLADYLRNVWIGLQREVKRLYDKASPGQLLDYMKAQEIIESEFAKSASFLRHFYISFKRKEKLIIQTNSNPEIAAVRIGIDEEDLKIKTARLFGDLTNLVKAKVRVEGRRRGLGNRIPHWLSKTEDELPQCPPRESRVRFAVPDAKGE